MAGEESKEFRIPAILLGISVAVFVLAALRIGGSRGVGAAVTALAVALAITVALMLLGAIITAKLIGVSFGDPRSAVLKLAAIAMFPETVAALIGITGVSWVISVILYFALLIYLFDLDTREALIFTGVLLVVRFIAMYLVAMMALS